jgi:pyrroloquinoline quinone biosynthesis protein E
VDVDYEYPALKRTVRVNKFDDGYLWVIEGLSGFRHIALPFEVALLSLCDGATSQSALADVIKEISCGKLHDDETQDIVNMVLSKFSLALECGDGLSAHTPQYNFADYLYPVRPIGQYPKRLPSPIEMLLTLTSRCNLKCIYCFNNSGDAHIDELTTREWLDLIAQADEIGVKKVHLTGGEPMLHLGAVAIIKELKRRGMLIELATNGTLHYTDEVLTLLNHERVDISLDTADADLYMRLTGRPYFEQVVNAIKRFVSAGVAVSIKTCITSLNGTGIDRLYALLSGLHVDNIGLAAYTASISGRGGDELLLSTIAIDNVRREFEQIKQMESTSMVFGIPNIRWNDKEDIISCDALAHTIIVMPNGDVTPCELITDSEEFCFGNVRFESLMQIWKSAKVTDFFYKKSHPDDKICQTCVYLESCCTGCFAEKLYKNILPYGRDPRCNIIDYCHTERNLSTATIVGLKP